MRIVPIIFYFFLFFACCFFRCSRMQVLIDRWLRVRSLLPMKVSIFPPRISARRVNNLNGCRITDALLVVQGARVRTVRSGGPRRPRLHSPFPESRHNRDSFVIPGIARSPNGSHRYTLSLIARQTAYQRIPAIDFSSNSPCASVRRAETAGDTERQWKERSQRQKRNALPFIPDRLSSIQL